MEFYKSPASLSINRALYSYFYQIVTGAGDTLLSKGHVMPLRHNLSHFAPVQPLSLPKRMPDAPQGTITVTGKWASQL